MNKEQTFTVSRETLIEFLNKSDWMPRYDSRLIPAFIELTGIPTQARIDEIDGFSEEFSSNPTNKLRNTLNDVIRVVNQLRDQFKGY